MSGEPSIIRTPRTTDRPFFPMARATAQDRNLSWEARGVLAYLLSKPDDWQVMVKDLQQNCGRDKVRGILKELINAGYLSVEQRKNEETGKYDTNHYTVHETPFTENPSTVLPSTENPPLTYNRRKQKTEEHTPLTPKGGKGRKRKTERADHATWLANEYAPHRALAEALRTPFLGMDVPPENSTRASLMPYLEAARELSALGASAEDAAKLYSYVKKRAADEQWKVRFGVNALLKHYPEWRAQQQRKAKQAASAAQSAPPQVPILLLNYDAPEENLPGAREVAS